MTPVTVNIGVETDLGRNKKAFIYLYFFNSKMPLRMVKNQIFLGKESGNEGEPMPCSFDRSVVIAD